MTTTEQQNNKRIAKNTLLLYFRMFFSMAISLYTSRIVLNALGFEDYGIYNVVGGVVAMFSFLNASMSGAASRFLTFQLGKGDYDALKKNFGVAKTIHLFIAILVILLAETIGLYFLNYKLVIPESRIYAANIVFQCCILSTFFTITQVPYTACIMSHEKMTVYAVLEIVNTGLKLVAVFLLVLGSDKLVLWGVLTAGITIFISMFYRIYCWLNHLESRSKFSVETNIMKSMLNFSGWDLYGNLSVMAQRQGVNMLLNLFFGPIMNAAVGIATNVQSSVMALSSNLVVAMRPQIVKRYACGEIESMLKLLDGVSKLAFLLISVLTIPLIVEIDYVLSLWLGKVPKHASQICVYVLLFNIFANQSTILVSVIHATGKIFRLSFVNGTLYLLVIPVSYVSFKFGGGYWTSFLFNVIAVFLGVLYSAWTIQLYIPSFSFKAFLVKNIVSYIVIFVMVLSLCLGVHQVLDQGLIRLVVNTLMSSCLLSVIFFRFMLSRNMQQDIMKKIKGKICRNHY